MLCEKFFELSEKQMANGMRDNRRTPLNNDEINKIQNEISRIQADPNKFIINDKTHIQTGTGYNFDDDIIYVSRNVLPDKFSDSTHPRDTMTIAAVLAHEYYGHRPNRDEYLKYASEKREITALENTEDECNASINAAKTTPGLSQKERADLIRDAELRAKENGYIFEFDSYMKEVLYEHIENPEHFTTQPGRIALVKQDRELGASDKGDNPYKMSSMRNFSEIIF